MLLVQEPGGAEGEEELGAVGVLAPVGHRDDAAGGVGDDEVLVVEGGAVDAGACGARDVSLAAFSTTLGCFIWSLFIYLFS